MSYTTPDRMNYLQLQAYDRSSVTIASLLRLAYFIHRFYYGKVDPSITTFRVNVIR